MSALKNLRAQIHIGCKELGLDADARHDLQLVETGKASMSDMTEADMLKVLKRLKTEGFSPRKTRFKHKKADRKDLRLVHVLWRKLGEAGALKDPSRDGLNKFIRSRFGGTWGAEIADVDMLKEHSKIDDVIRALKSWGERAEIDFDWEEHQR